LTSVSALDPTGLLGAAAAFVQPNCNWTPPPPPPANKFLGDIKGSMRATIRGASWGTLDVTAVVSKMYLSGTFNISASNTVFGDGLPGFAKSLVIVVLYNNNYRTLYAAENSYIVLPYYNSTLTATASPDPYASTTNVVVGAAYGL